MLISCRDCSRPISDAAEACLGCGAPSIAPPPPEKTLAYQIVLAMSTGVSTTAARYIDWTGAAAGAGLLFIAQAVDTLPKVVGDDAYRWSLLLLGSALLLAFLARVIRFKIEGGQLTRPQVKEAIGQQTIDSHMFGRVLAHVVEALPSYRSKRVERSLARSLDDPSFEARREARAADGLALIALIQGALMLAAGLTLVTTVFFSSKWFGNGPLVYQPGELYARGYEEGFNQAFGAACAQERPEAQLSFRGDEYQQGFARGSLAGSARCVRDTSDQAVELRRGEP